MTFRATVPAVAQAYFGVPAQPSRGQHPIVTATFHPDRGWQQYPIRKRVSGSWVRQARHDGITAVTLIVGERNTDFTVDELSRDDPWGTLKPVPDRGIGAEAKRDQS